MHKYSLYFQYSNLKSQQNKIWDSTFITILLIHLVSFRYFNASISINIQQAISTFLRIKPESSLFISPKPWFKTINIGIDFRSRIFVRDTLVLFTSISSNVDFKLWIILTKDSRCAHVWKNVQSFNLDTFETFWFLTKMSELVEWTNLNSIQMARDTSWKKLQV